MSIRTRLSGGERREAIIFAARRAFAEKGFHGATTRELASEAGVSEALLFKHFPNKEAIYDAMLESCRKTDFANEYHRLLALESSTSTLVLTLHFLLSRTIHGDTEIKLFHRLMLRSMCEDGVFAGLLFKKASQMLVPKIRECVDAAARAGETRNGADTLKNAGWLAQHLVLMVAFMQVPEHCLVEYKGSKDKWIEEGVVFCLRGLGLSDQAIARHYNPRALQLLASPM